MKPVLLLPTSKQCRSHWGQEGQSAPLDSEKFAKNRGKEGENQEKWEKEGKKRKNREGYFSLHLLTDRAGYATASKWSCRTEKWAPRYTGETTLSTLLPWYAFMFKLLSCKV